MIAKCVGAVFSESGVLLSDKPEFRICDRCAPWYRAAKPQHRYGGLCRECNKRTDAYLELLRDAPARKAE